MRFGTDNPLSRRERGERKKRGPEGPLEGQTPRLSHPRRRGRTVGQAALKVLCGSMTNFFGTPASNSP